MGTASVAALLIKAWEQHSGGRRYSRWVQTAEDLHACSEQPEPAALLLGPRHSMGRSLASLRTPTAKALSVEAHEFRSV